MFRVTEMSIFFTSGSFFETQVSPLYFDRNDVKAAIHAPTNVDWVLCTDVEVFPEGDASLPPAFTVLPNVIEKSKRSVIVHGRADFLLIAEGARIVLQKYVFAVCLDDHIEYIFALLSLA
jgi:carboxypeptidase D